MRRRERHLYLPWQSSGGPRCRDNSDSIVDIECLASSISINHLAMPREETKPPGDNEDQHNDVRVTKGSYYCI